MGIGVYYAQPQKRCSTNSESVFGISTASEAEFVGSPNVWIMSQTTYASFFAMVLGCVFSVCGSCTLMLQAVTRRRNRKVHVEKDEDEVVEVIAPQHKG